MSRPRVLITGGLGYLGGRLVQALSGRDYSVIGTSRRVRAAPEAWPSGADLRVLDPMGAPEALAEALKGVDVIVHLAAANEIDSARDPEQAMIDTGFGTRRLLEAAITVKVRRFLFLSTIHVYGAPLTGALDEARAPRPAHPYAVSHRLGEDFVLAAHQAGRIEGVVARLSNGIGAPAWTEVDRWSLIGNDLARQIASQGRIVLKTPGLQWRDFITLTDFCAGIGCLIDAPAARLGDGLFNLGGQLPLRIIDVAQAMAQAAQAVTGRAPAIERPMSDDPGEPIAFVFPTGRIEALGFAPTGALHLPAELLASIRLCQ